jgi:hypothetical protein
MFDCVWFVEGVRGKDGDGVISRPAAGALLGGSCCCARITPPDLRPEETLRTCTRRGAQLHNERNPPDLRPEETLRTCTRRGAQLHNERNPPDLRPEETLQTCTRRGAQLHTERSPSDLPPGRSPSGLAPNGAKEKGGRSRLFSDSDVRRQVPGQGRGCAPGDARSFISS